MSLVGLVLVGAVTTGVGDAPFRQSSGVHLLAQAAPSMEILAPASLTADDLRSQINEINGRLLRLKTDWPTGAVVLLGVGIGLSGLGFLGGGFLALVVAALGAPGPALLIWLATTLAGLPLIIPGIIWGTTSAAASKRQREQLIQDRTSLERQLQSMPGAPPMTPVLPGGNEPSSPMPPPPPPQVERATTVPVLAWAF